MWEPRSRSLSYHITKPLLIVIKRRTRYGIKMRIGDGQVGFVWEKKEHIMPYIH